MLHYCTVESWPHGEREHGRNKVPDWEAWFCNGMHTKHFQRPTRLNKPHKTYSCPQSTPEVLVSNLLTHNHNHGDVELVPCLGIEAFWISIELQIQSLFLGSWPPININLHEGLEVFWSLQTNGTAFRIVQSRRSLLNFFSVVILLCEFFPSFPVFPKQKISIDIILVFLLDQKWGTNPRASRPGTGHQNFGDLAYMLSNIW